MKQDLTKQNKGCDLPHRPRAKRKEIIMKNLFAYDFVNETIVASKTTLKKAGKPGTTEYKALMKMMKGQPTFKIAEKEINVNESKNTHKGLTLAVMIAHIEKQSNSEELMEEFEAVKEFGKYPLTKKWFLDKFPTFKISEGKKAVSAARITKATANIKSKKVLTLAPAVGQ